MRGWQLPRFLFIVCLAQALAILADAQYTAPVPAGPQNGVTVGPTYKLSDIAAQNDLVKLSGQWWGVAYDNFLSASGMKATDFLVMDDPVDTTVKELSPTADLRRNWTPAVLPPLVFKFDSNKGLVEISGFLPKASANTNVAQTLPVGVTEDQAAVVSVLAARYGKPTRILGNPNAPALGATYVWDFDKASLEVSSIEFRLFPSVN